MPGDQAARDPVGLRPDQARDQAAVPLAPVPLAPKVLYAIDGTLAPGSAAASLRPLTAVVTAAVAAGGGHVLDASHAVFPNGAITLVMILAESHLSVHTWPEEALIAIDLFSCGAIDGDAVADRLVRGLRLDQVRIRRLGRGAPAR